MNQQKEELFIDEQQRTLLKNLNYEQQRTLLKEPYKELMNNKDNEFFNKKVYLAGLRCKILGFSPILFNTS